MTQKTRATLYYVHDPMCSWCWGFQPVWEQTEVALSKEEGLSIEYLVGGLAPDTDEPMPEDLKATIPGYWRKIQEHIPGTKFNFDFWELNQARRSTYPSCRAVLAAKLLEPSKEKEMILGIQQAYYLHAKNPSNDSTLVEVAASIGFDRSTFEQALNSEATNQLLAEQLKLTHEINARSFPSLILKRGRLLYRIPHDYHSAGNNIALIQRHLR